MEMRLQKFLAQCGVASRRASEKLILEGKVKINGKIETRLGTKIDTENDSIFFQNKKLQKNNYPSQLYAFYKPRNCITSLKDEHSRKTIVEYLPKVPTPLFPIGRLDYDSEGLLLITNNGDWAWQISHPKNKIKKTYLVKIDKDLNENQWKKINQPMMIEKKLHRAKVKFLSKINQKSWVQVELYQGRNLQIKKMFFQIGVRVLKIKRVQIGKIVLQNLGVGQFRILSRKEREGLLTTS